MNRLVHNRWLVFGAIVLAVVAVSFFSTGSLLPTPDSSGLWFYSGFFLLAFSVFFVEPYFNSPQTTLANAVPTLLVLATSRTDFAFSALWLACICLSLVLIVAAVVAMALGRSPISSAGRWVSTVALWLTRTAGRAKVLLTVIFFSLLFGVDNSIADNVVPLAFVLALWAAVVALNPANFPKTFGELRRPTVMAGELFSLESRNVGRVRLRSGTRIPSLGAPVSLNSGETGEVIGTTRLHDEDQVRVRLDSGVRTLANSAEGVTFGNPPTGGSTQDGIVLRGSSVETIFVRELDTRSLFVGETIRAAVAGKDVFYQVLDIQVESLAASPSDAEGFRTVEASQLGYWDATGLAFKTLGTVPELHHAVARAVATAAPTVPKGLFVLGDVPGTGLPATLDLLNTLDHHVAVIGATGSGKTHLADRMLKHIEDTIKTVCVDFTGEWAKKRPGFFPIEDPADVPKFLASDKRFAILEFKSATNTVATVANLATIMETLLAEAKTAYAKGAPLSVCLVLEEAHTIVPEQSFLGVNNFDAKASVNKISQIALQGRKYGVGMLVLAQRTANVSKTVLTQCNSVISFRVFDETSIGFLSNYFGNDVARALGRLPDRHAVVAGKASASDRPVIADLA